MAGPLILRPGLTTLADWRAVYRGAPLSMDPIARLDVDAGAAALTTILARREQPLAENDASPTIAEMTASRSEFVPAAVARLICALKLASLAQGLSGVRWQVVEALSACLDADLVPAIPEHDVDDRLALSHVYALLTGAGEALASRRGRPAASALKKAALKPLALLPQERPALLSGAQASTAFALAGLFEAERSLQSSMVAASLSAAASAPCATLHPRAHRVHRQAGQMEVAHAFRDLTGLSAGGAARPNGGNGDRERGVGGCAFRLGACLDLLRQAGHTLEAAGNAVSENRLVLWQSEEIVNGAQDLSSIGFANRLTALALREIGAMAEERIAAAGDDFQAAGEATTPLAMARAFLAEFHPDPAALSDDGDSTRSGGPRGLLPLAGATALVVAVEALTAARASDPSDDDDSRPLARARRLLGKAGETRKGDGSLSAHELAAAVELVRSGALAEAPGIPLPGLAPPRPTHLSA